MDYDNFLLYSMYRVNYITFEVRLAKWPASPTILHASWQSKMTDYMYSLSNGFNTCNIIYDEQL